MSADPRTRLAAVRAELDELTALIDDPATDPAQMGDLAGRAAELSREVTRLLPEVVRQAEREAEGIRHPADPDRPGAGAGDDG